VLAVGVGGWWAYARAGDGKPASARPQALPTVPIARGDLVTTLQRQDHPLAKALAHAVAAKLLCPARASRRLLVGVVVEVLSSFRSSDAVLERVVRGT
jgi:hypothetical protein